VSERELFEAWNVKQYGYYPRKNNDSLDSALFACWQAATASQWQPIETAPKDGRKIIVFYLNRNKLPRTVMASWLSEEQANDIDNDGAGLNAGWYERTDNWDDYSHIAIQEGKPTNWMPLPQPPKK
jgi:hypothetical protein